MVHSQQLSLPTAETAYEDEHINTMQMATRIQEILQDLPAPGDHQQPIRWPQVEELRYANAKLAEVVHFLERPSEAETPAGRRGGWFPSPEDGSQSID